MKRLLVVSLVFCLACEPEPFETLNTLPVSEYHYNLETGQKIGHKILAYDASSRLVSEHYFNDIDPMGDIEVIYEYNSDGNLIRRKERNPNGENIFYITELTYQNGHKKTETTYFENNPNGYRTLYFFTGSRMDSTEAYFYANFEQEYRYSYTTYYEYDGAKVIRAYSSNGGETVYGYSETLNEVCDLYPGDNGATIRDCIVKISDRGLVTEVFRHVSSSLGGTQYSETQEELFYRDGRLHEKRLYTFPVYDQGNTIDIKQIKYTY